MIRFFPEKRASVSAIPAGSKKASCFSAVLPVSGWNQCVKWVAPRSMPHCFRACATSFAMEGSSGVWSRIVCNSASAVSFAKYSRIARSLNTSEPYAMSVRSIAMSRSIWVSNDLSVYHKIPPRRRKFGSFEVWIALRRSPACGRS